MKIKNRGVAVAASLVAISTLALGACSTEEAADTAKSATSSATSMASEATSAASSAMNKDEAKPAEGSPMGPLCKAYADAHPEGPASLETISKQNVVEALPNIPKLSTLTSALTGKLNPDVNLASVIQDGTWTIFAPTNEAFAKIDAQTLEKLKTDPELLKSILTYHVVDGKADASKVNGEHTTVNGKSLKVTNEGDQWKVNDAGIGCGDIPTENAQVYLIDSVLLPPQ